MDLQLRGKRALVTGSSAGIGQSIARTLAREGVKVVAHGRDRARTEAEAAHLRAAGGEAAWTIGDLSSDSEANAVADKALAVFGGIDILINNAGGRDYANWEFHTPERWLQRYSANTLSALRLAFRLVPGMQEQGWGRLIQIGSIAGAMPNADYGDYAASKAGLLSLTVSIAQRFGRDGITSNMISVGMVLSDSSQILPKIMRETGCTRDEAERKAATDYLKTAVGRFARVEEVANFAAFVASPLAGYITGANLRLDGGTVPTINP